MGSLVRRTRRRNARQAFKDVKHKGRGDYWRYKINEGQGKHARDDRAAAKNLPREAMANLSDRAEIEPPQGNQFKIFSAEQVAV